VIDRAGRVAVLSDVHGNPFALEAVLAEVARVEPDVVVFGGDLTWGPLPHETLELVAALELPTRFVRGNAERLLLEGGDDPDERRQWLLTQHTDAELAFLRSFEPQFALEIDGLGAVRFCHGSPRGDTELVTPATPADRIGELAAGVPERVIVSAHTHLQFDRAVAGVRSVNPGSVGVPYEPSQGAYWALLGPDVELRRTAYDLGSVVAAYRASGDPAAERMIQLLRNPPTRQEVIEHAERHVDSD
jgi:putative phosphoesterase